MYHRLTSVFLSVVVAIILCLPSAAYAEQGLAALPQDIDELALREEIAQFINENKDVYFAEGKPKGILSTGLSASDIDLSLTVKLYNGPELFSEDASDFAAIKEQLENERYMMLVIQMYFEGDTYQAEVVKGVQPDYSHLEGEVLEEFLAHPEWAEDSESKVGKWYVQTVGYIKGIQPDFIKVAAERTGIYDREPMLVKGLPYFHYPVAIYPDDEGNLATMTVIYPATAPWEELGIERPGEDAEFVFDYEFVKEKVDSAPPEGGDAGGVPQDTSKEDTTPPSMTSEPSDLTQTAPASPDDSKLPVLGAIFAGIVLAAAIVTIIVIRRRQAAKKQSAERQSVS